MDLSGSPARAVVAHSAALATSQVERILRQLLRYPNAPAVVLVHAYPFWSMRTPKGWTQKGFRRKSLGKAGVPPKVPWLRPYALEAATLCIRGCDSPHSSLRPCACEATILCCQGYESVPWYMQRLRFYARRGCGFVPSTPSRAPRRSRGCCLETSTSSSTGSGATAHMSTWWMS